VNWTQNEMPISTDPDFQFNVTSNRALVGHFALDCYGPSARAHARRATRMPSRVGFRAAM
jgi:hypothetical protein